MATEETREVVKGDGFAVGNIAEMGDQYGFRKIRRELDVEAFGINAISMPPGYETGRHYHEQQEETYFVHEGSIEMEFGDGSRHLLGPGGVARVDPATVRKVRNASKTEDAVYLIVGGKGGYVGRDGVLPEGEVRAQGVPPGAGDPGQVR
jgi:mannose-6-phosphate isomerase-like protein (cupin superfamily)